MIELRILRRDDNLDIMDQYLTGTARSISKLVAFSAQGEPCFPWGSRSREAQHLRERLKSEGLSGDEISKRMIEWYDDGGWRQVDDELAEAMEEVVKAA